MDHPGAMTVEDPGIMLADPPLESPSAEGSSSLQSGIVDDIEGQPQPTDDERVEEAIQATPLPSHGDEVPTEHIHHTPLLVHDGQDGNGTSTGQQDSVDDESFTSSDEDEEQHNEEWMDSIVESDDGSLTVVVPDGGHAILTRGFLEMMKDSREQRVNGEVSGCDQ